MKWVRWISPVLLFVSLSYAQGWLGQKRIEALGTYNVSPCIAFEPTTHRPWIVWTSGLDLVFTRWLGDRWDEPRVIVRGSPDPNLRLMWYPRLTFDSEGRAWVVWEDLRDDSTGGGIYYDVGFSYWQDTFWAPDGKVNEPDADSINDWIADISWGGGEIWCVWHFFPHRGNYPGHLYARRWDRERGEWGPQMRVTPDYIIKNYIPSLAVDSTGTPHVVWSVLGSYMLLYSFYKNGEWQEPVLVTDTNYVTGLVPSLTIDRNGVMHLAFLGGFRNAQRTDIFYCRNDGTGWSEPVLVSQDSGTHQEWICSVAASCTSNVWVVFVRQYPDPKEEFRVYATHYDGEKWAPEERIDDSTLQAPEASEDWITVRSVALDENDFPWVVSRVYLDSGGNNYSYHIYYNRYGYPPGVEEELGREKWSWTIASPSRGALKIQGVVPVTGAVVVEVFDAAGRQVASREIKSIGLSGQPVTLIDKLSAGVYACRIKVGGKIIVRKFVTVK
ncbi:MAG: T9SS type A sorting domain-containing protein [candidate division WOR-3 bacterium]